VYLPRGAWIDYWDPTRRLTGPTTVTVDAPLDRIPLFVRAGGMLPLDVGSSVTGNGSAASAGRLTIDAYPAGASRLVVHEAAGDTTFTLTDQACDRACVRLGISGSQRGYIARILTAAPASVQLDGGPIAQAASFAELEQAASGWFYDAAAGRVWVKFATVGPAAQLEVDL
jgi:hypothetical protein